jgi:hypothetical protein
MKKYEYTVKSLSLLVPVEYSVMIIIDPDKQTRVTFDNEIFNEVIHLHYYFLQIIIIHWYFL